MKIFEIFDTHTKARLVRNSNNAFVIDSDIGNKTIRFIGTSDGRGFWKIEFIDNSDEDKSPHSLSGSGNEMQIFSFVIDCIRELINRRQPEVIKFISDKSDKSRTQLYSVISRRVKIPGYHCDIEIGNNSQFDTFKIVKGNLNESKRYSEEPGSFFSHDGEEYLLNPLISVTRNFPVYEIPIDKLDWILKYSNDDRDVEYADINEPILVGKWKNKLVVHDGLHRLKRAIELGKEFIPGKFVSDRLLSYFRINKEKD